MAEEIVMFRTSDGKTFKTKKGAENHDKKIEVAKTLERLNMSESEVSQKLLEVSPYNVTIRGLLKMEPDWRKWSKNLIAQINERILSLPDKKTVYVKEFRSWGETKEEEIAVETGDEFFDVNKHCGDGHEEYKVVKTEQVDDYTLKVFYDYKHTEEERIAIKLKTGVSLTESEIEFMVYELCEIYAEEGDEGRWERFMTTVVELEGEKYAIDWSRGLTESQENSFYEQPYPVDVIEEEVTIVRKVIKRK